MPAPQGAPAGQGKAMTWDGRYDNVLETLGNTPVVEIGKLTPSHAALYVKIEAFNPLGSVKHRLAPAA